MLKDILLIFLFLIVIISILQLRFDRSRIARTLMWTFLVIVALLFLLQLTLDNEFFHRNKVLLDSVFWTSLGGVFITYAYLKNSKS